MDDLPLEAIRRLLALVDAYHLQELVLEEDGVRVTIRTETPAPTPAPLAAAPETELPAAEMSEPLHESEEATGLHALRSPMTGVFYRTSGPDSPPFVVEDQFVEEGDTVGLLEAMKVFSEIPADITGRVVRILAENGKLQHEGDVLLLIDTTAG